MPSPAVHGTPLLALTQAANQAVLAQQAQQAQHPSPLLFPAAPASSQEWLQQPPVAGERTPGTPAFALLQQQRQQPGWQAGASSLLDERLLMTQLTQQHLQRQQQLHDEPMAKQQSLDADAQAWLQVSDSLAVLRPHLHCKHRMPPCHLGNMRMQ